MHWNTLTRDSQLDTIIEQSANRPRLIFKHSTRCAISGVVKGRLERSDPPAAVDFHYLDQICFRLRPQPLT